MPRYALKPGGEVAKKQYADLPEDTRRLVNQRIEELLENPTGNPDWEYDAQFDQHTVPIGNDKGFIVYTVVESSRVVIPLRYTPGID
jgi:hypothetical protein